MSDFSFDDVDSDVDRDAGETMPKSGVRSLDGDDDDAGMPEQPALQIVAKYPILKQLGKGGMGEVWLGHHPDLDIPVAIKTLPTHLISRDPGFVERFIKEARTAARINHPNVVRIYDAGKYDDLHYIVMEYVDGGDVHELLEEKKGPLEIKRALDIIIQVAEGLKAAAEFSIIHRDIKPENVMLDKKGTPKLADLGLAKQIGGMDEMSMTGTGMAVGTPSYMAPEQIQDAKSCDARADIYALGAMLYHLVTGDVPFSASSSFDMMIKHIQEPLLPPQEKNPDIPDNIAAVICKMMEKSPEERYQSAAELLGDLNKIKHGNVPVKKLLAAQSMRTIKAKAGSAAEKAGKDKAGKSKAGLVAGIAILVLATVAGVAYMVRKNGTTHAKVDPSPADSKIIIVDSSKATELPLNPIKPDTAQPTVVVSEPVAVKPSEAEPRPANVDPAPVLAKEEPENPVAAEPEPVVVEPEPVNHEPEPTQEQTVTPAAPALPALGNPVELSASNDAPTGDLKLWRFDDLQMTFVPVPAGQFTMGSDSGRATERPEHTVVIPTDFWMMDLEVTNAQFKQFADAEGFQTDAEKVNHSWRREADGDVKLIGMSYQKQSDESAKPVVCVSWNDAVAFTDWLNAQVLMKWELPEGYEFRLPTEAEWEYTCRAGYTGSFGYSSLFRSLGSYAVFNENSDGEVAKCGTRKANRWGLYDLHGNVAEWCMDAMGGYTNETVVSPVQLTGDKRVLRGGSYSAREEDCSVFAREANEPTFSAVDIGFRVVLAPSLTK